MTTQRERFFSFIHFEPMSGCWLWAGAQWGNGYGYFSASHGHGVSAHRFSYELHKGKLSPGMHVLHLCDTPACCNPDHLVAGNHRENMAHMMARGRKARGERVGNSKLTGDLIAQIRERHAGGESQVHIAKCLGLHSSWVSRIVNRHAWAQVS